MTAAIFYNPSSTTYEFKVIPEQVLCFPANLLSPYEADFAANKGILTRPTQVNAVFQHIMRSDKLTFVERSKAELDPSWKQLIPYCLLRDDKNRVFAYQRTKKGGESRLHDRFSFGVGGHLNPVDGESPSRSTYWNGLFRELLEEVGLSREGLVCPATALIYDPSNEVGKVHFGVVHNVQVGNRMLKCLDSALANGRFIDTDGVGIHVLESWSQLVLRAVFGLDTQ